MGLLDAPAYSRAQADALRKTLRRREIPGYTALPTLMATPPTVTLGAANAATTITSSVLVPMNQPGAFSYNGCGDLPVKGGTAPSQYYFTTGMYPVGTAAPYGVEFDFDTADSTGRFEISTTGQNAGVRVLVNGKYATQLATFKPAANGSTYLGLVTLGAAGVYRIRLECDSNFRFLGIRVSPTDTVRAVHPKRQRWVILGDSFSEPTIIDSGGSHSWDGWPLRLSYLLGVDVIACGSGGTGYLNPGTRVKFRDRYTEATSLNPDVIVVGGGINDFGAYTASAIGTEALALFQAIRAALPSTPIVVLSPWWKAGFQTYTANMLLTKAAIKTAAGQVSNTLFLDSLQLALPETPPASTTLQATVAAGVTAVSLGVLYPIGTYFQIGTDTNAEVRQVTSTSGTGPYTTNFNGTGGSVLLNAHTSGEVVTPCGPGVYTGTGKQGAVQSNGNADRYTGTDGTHPTVLGHDNLARWFGRAYVETLSP